MEPETKTTPPQTPAPTPEAPAPAEPTVYVHTYEDDMSRAMNVSDAAVVQDLLATAREKEVEETVRKKNKKLSGWYVTGSIILILAALLAAAYGTYHYIHLTVPAQTAVSVGVFPSTDPIVSNDTDIRQVVTHFTTDAPLAEDKPYLVNLVSDSTSQTLLSNQALFSFMEASPTEPFATSLSVVRLGMMNTGTKTVPFIIFSVPNPEVTNKEFLIAEPTLLSMFYKALNIDISAIPTEANQTFTGEYRYNLPVRTLYTPDQNGDQQLTLMYGSVTDNIIVLTTDPSVLKSIYDTIIRQI